MLIIKIMQRNRNVTANKNNISYMTIYYNTLAKNIFMVFKHMKLVEKVVNDKFSKFK